MVSEVSSFSILFTLNELSESLKESEFKIPKK